jgi:hypothetical protein
LKGFGIYVKNDLLEPKHYLAMGEAIWLYLWLLDRMTSVNENGVGKVLAGRPITYAMVAEDIGVSRQVYVRWMKQLRQAGYIQTLRTPVGLCITVQKAQKIFGNRSIKSDTSPEVKKGSIKNSTSPKRSAKNDTSDVSKSKHLMRQNRASNNNNTINNTNTIQTTTDVVGPDGLGPKPVYGKPEINELFSYWSKECGYDIETRVTANRRAASSLLKKHGAEKLKSMIRGVSMTQSDRYAPSISDFTELQQKLPALLVWGKKKMHGELEDQPTVWRAGKK